MKWIAFVAAAAVVGLSVPAGAGEYKGPGFSGIAWFGENGKADQKLGPMNVDRGGFRMEVSQQGQSMAMLLYWDKEMSYSLMMKEKMYMEIPAEQTGSTAADFNGAPCDGYQGSEKIGSETVNGRSTEL